MDKPLEDQFSPSVARYDARVAAILTDPDGYFATARRRAWKLASAEIDYQLAKACRQPTRESRTAITSAYHAPRR